MTSQPRVRAPWPPPLALQAVRCWPVSGPAGQGTWRIAPCRARQPPARGPTAPAAAGPAWPQGQHAHSQSANGRPHPLHGGARQRGRRWVRRETCGFPRVFLAAHPAGQRTGRDGTHETLTASCRFVMSRKKCRQVAAATPFAPLGVANAPDLSSLGRRTFIRRLLQPLFQRPRAAGETAGPPTRSRST